MKKLLFTLALVSLFAVSAQAQLKYGIRGGVNLSSLSGDGDEFVKNTTGFFIGPSLEASFLGLGIEGSILYSQKGINLKGHSDEKTGYIEVPVNFRYKLGLPIVSKLVTPFFDAGPYINFRVSGDKNISDVAGDLKAKDFGAGLNFGLGVELFNKVQVKGGYTLGLTESYKGGLNDVSLKDRSWNIGVGVYF